MGQPILLSSYRVISENQKISEIDTSVNVMARYGMTLYEQDVQRAHAQTEAGEVYLPRSVRMYV